LFAKIQDDQHNDDWGKMLDNLRVHIERVIAYWSQLFKGAETRYLATEQEALAAKEGLHQRQEDSFSHRPRRTPVGKDVQKHKQTPRRVGCRIFGVLGPAHRTPARKSSLKRGSLVAASATGASVCRTKVGWVRAHQHVWSARSVDPNWGVRFNNNLSEIAASAKVSTAAVTRLQPPRLKKGVPASRTTFTIPGRESPEHSKRADKLKQVQFKAPLVPEIQLPLALAFPDPKTNNIFSPEEVLRELEAPV
jgi:hypothetical protein